METLDWVPRESLWAGCRGLGTVCLNGLQGQSHWRPWLLSKHRERIRWAWIRVTVYIISCEITVSECDREIMLEPCALPRYAVTTVVTVATANAIWSPNRSGWLRK